MVTLKEILKIMLDRINNIIENNEEKKITLKDSLNNQIKISFGQKKTFCY